MRVDMLINLLCQQDPEFEVKGLCFDGYVQDVVEVKGESQTGTVWLKLEDY